jgi:hypothetical protein
LVVNDNCPSGDLSGNPQDGSCAAPPPSDTTAPVITKVVTGTQNNGWYTSDVKVEWNVSDPDSAVVIDSGCGTQNFTSSTASVTSSCTAHSAGGTATDSVELKIDKEVPSVSVSPDRAPNGNDWYNSPVTFSASGSDYGPSGPGSCDANENYGGPDSATASVSMDCTDGAGNKGTGSLSFKYDDTDPEITFTRTAANANNWNNEDVAVDFTCDDNLSGVDGACGPDQTLTSEGADQSATGNVTDQAGNSASATVTDINIDKTAPTISATLNPANPAVSGWYNISTGAPKASYTCSDTLSGLDGTCPGVFTFGEGNDLSHSETISDQADNQATAAVTNIKVDLTKPTLIPTVSPNPVLLGGAATASAGASDTPGSGIASSSCANPVNTGTIGAGQTVSCSATDNAGNTNTASATYSVGAAFNGFLQPIDGNLVNTGKFGRVYPVKWQLRDASDALLSDAVAQALVSSMTVTQRAVTCDSGTPTDALETEAGAAGSTSVRYDAASDQFIFNYKAPSSGSCYSLNVNKADGINTQSILFKFTK